jgi:hypothetical protein
MVDGLYFCFAVHISRDGMSFKNSSSIIEKNEMGWACGEYGGGERCAQGFGGEARGNETIGETQT